MDFVKIIQHHPAVEIARLTLTPAPLSLIEKSWEKQNISDIIKRANSTQQTKDGEQGKSQESTPLTKNKAKEKAENHASVPRDGRGGEDIPIDEVNETSRGRNWQEQKANGATKSGRRSIYDSNPSEWYEHPDGHPDAGQENVPEHHDSGHFHSTNKKGEKIVIPYINLLK